MLNVTMRVLSDLADASVDDVYLMDWFIAVNDDFTRTEHVANNV